MAVALEEDRDEGTDISNSLTALLDAKHVSHELIPHRHTETAAAEARAIRVDPAQVAKTLVLVTEDGFVRAVLPSNERIDLEKVRQALDGENVQLATEQVLSGAYPDFELDPRAAIAFYEALGFSRSREMTSSVSATRR